jgi:hypothetical protein
MKRVFLSLILLGIALLVGRPAFAGGGSGDAPVNLRISISPVQGNANTAITVSGTGANPGVPVSVALAPQTDTAANALATTQVNPNPDGTFRATLTVPANTADGQYAVRAQQVDGSGRLLQFYWHLFNVGAGAGVSALPSAGGVMEGTASPVVSTLALLLLIGLGVRGIYAVRYG